jgi:hypothetical protein
MPAAFAEAGIPWTTIGVEPIRTNFTSVNLCGGTARSPRGQDQYGDTSNEYWEIREEHIKVRFHI